MINMIGKIQLTQIMFAKQNITERGKNEIPNKKEKNRI